MGNSYDSKGINYVNIWDDWAVCHLIRVGCDDNDGVQGSETRAS